jgi:HAD superfamily hydrolase (TIGR01509 family)
VALLHECYEIAQKQGHKLYVCTNWSMGYIDMLEQDFPNIFAMFDGIVTPTVAQAKKPDVKIFQYLLNTYNLIPHHSIFIDDQMANVDAAQSIGMTGVHMHDYGHVREELKRHSFFV